MNINGKYGNITINVGTNPNRKKEGFNTQASERDLAIRDKLIKKFTDRDENTKK